MDIVSTEMRYFPFTLGDMECNIISDGTYSFPAKTFFKNAPDEELTPILAKYGIEDGKIKVPFHCLLVRTLNYNALIDTGLGGSVGTTSGKLVENLVSAGISPDSINAVLFSHGHFDHIGGALDKMGNLLFPNARHIIGGDEYQFWNSDIGRELAGESRTMASHRILEILQDKLEFMYAEQEILPGIRTFAAPGHTPFHFLLS